MKKFLKIALRVVLSIIAVIALVLTTTTVVNAVATGSEKSRIDTYGQLVPVDGKNMNVVISGSGENTIVLIPGFGTASPALDFSPLIKRLETENRVVVVEPFGYGLSDQTDKERTSENIVTEIHEAVSGLGLEKYVLMGHSIAGIYGLEYANKYGDELTAFVGIDSSVPTQPGMDVQFPTGAMQAAKFLGIARIITELSGDTLAGMDFDEHTKDQMKLIAFQNNLTDTYVDEMKHIYPNFVEARRLTFPQTLPVLLFAQADNKSVAGWVELHEEQAATVDNGTVVLLDADHYLHHSKSAEIAADFEAFMADLNAGVTP
ncbi:alpha/beta fold hydrolase [Mycetocola spongiae]|uniref:alpha/beta fold hydrolase n=1 Tax=Mycetocola spongiae TaxID=2859226 RepID=UPI001CF23679|nr:alpha/beta hydrolase [Mycetocola spongiae]UCR89901.1 alpha/beta hydrolase [Mycetocola spongiae]